MSCDDPTRLRAALACAALALALICAPASLAGTFPYTLRVEVAYGTPRGPEDVRITFEEELVRELGARGCFASVRAVRADEDDEPGAGELTLALRLDDFKELTQFHASIAQQAAANDPGVRRQLVASFRAALHLALLAPEAERPVRAHTVRVQRTVRPVMFNHGADYARTEARSQGIHELVTEAANKVCRGSPGRLARQIEKARGVRSKSSRGR